MATFIHLSDLHIHTRHRHENENCKKLVKYIRDTYAHIQDPPIVLITGDVVHGDITRDEFDEQYSNAEEILRPLVDDFTVFIVPGNHDYAKNGLEFNPPSYEFFNEYILEKLLGITGAGNASPGGHHVYPLTHTVGTVVFVGLDSAIGNYDDMFQFARGALGKAQRDQLKVILKSCYDNGQQVVVYFHHHPFIRHDLTMQMDDADKVMGIMENMVDVLCFGHKHVSDAWPHRRGIDYIMASGKSTDTDDKGRLQFRHVKLEPGVLKVAMEVFAV